MSSEIYRYIPHIPWERVFKPADNSNGFWSSKKSSALLLLASLTLVNLVSNTGCVDELNVPKLSGTESPARPPIPTALSNIQTIPPERPPIEPYEIEFENLFYKLSSQPIKTDGKINIDEDLVRDFIQQAGQHILENGLTTQFTGKRGKRGIQRSIILDSLDKRSSVALSAHLQGKGPPPTSADIRVLKAVMINRITAQTTVFLFSDFKEDELTVFESSKPSSIKNFSFWEKGEAFYYYFSGLGEASMDDLSSVINVLENGKVNVDLTKKSTDKLDEKYNSVEINPASPKPLPTPKIPSLN